VHHSQKTAATINGAGEFPALDAAGKAASLLSQFAATEQSVIDKQRVTIAFDASCAALAPSLMGSPTMGYLYYRLHARRLNVSRINQVS
jgi:hypothetical protein